MGNPITTSAKTASAGHALWAIDRASKMLKKWTGGEISVNNNKIFERFAVYPDTDNS